ncbi:hypothetical protein NSMM_280003 [Nitrosomonas mobilis]|uniref:Uncharacterized protein n=1 Tax=Nitrosomonas mobilis TaxID=51642 RepID=A0A1G5SCC2_9PROT|nr:hypothetical protein NSMM_280003 [Nitrosomonas mobilis]
MDNERCGSDYIFDYSRHHGVLVLSIYNSLTDGSENYKKEARLRPARLLQDMVGSIILTERGEKQNERQN